MADALSGKRILIISPENWGLPHVSKHHYAIELAKRNNEVWYCGPNDTNDRTPEGINTIATPKIPRGMRFMPSWIRGLFNRRFALYFRQLCGAEIDIVWSFDTSRLFDLQQIFPGAFRILHIVDLSMDFQWKTAAQQAHVCFGVSDLICRKLSQRHSCVTKIPHGCDISFISERSEVIENNSAAYAGNLNIPYLNLHLLQELIQHYPNVTFHFYGPYNPIASSRKNEPAMSELLKANNVRYHGTLPPYKLWKELSSKSILFLCYDQRYREQIANPHKLMMYLSTGRPILSTTLLEYQWLKNLVHYEDNNGSYLRKFGELMHAGDTGSAERVRVAGNHSYPALLDKIAHTIESYEDA